MDDWQRRLRRDTVEASFLIFLILGQQEIGAWEGSRVSYGVTPLRRRNATLEEGESR